MLIRWIAVLALGGVALADETKKATPTCPVDGTKFDAVEVVRSDAQYAWGGLDADFCSHAFKTLPMEHYIWTCPKCHYSGGKADFDAKLVLTPEQKAAIQGNLKPLAPIRPNARQEEIPGHVKYDLAAQVLERLGRPAADVAKKRLHASWAARQAGTAWLEHLDEWTELREALGLEKSPMELGKKNRTDLDLEVAARVGKDVAGKDVKTTDVLLRKYACAWLTRRHGENVEALAWIAELEKAKGFNSVVDEATAKMKESIAAERIHQAKAAEGYAAALEAGSVPAERRGETQYLLGELKRRLGDKAAAASWFAKCLEGAPEAALKKRAEDQKKKCE